MNSDKRPGAGNVTRTRDLLITSEMLYQLSYTSVLVGFSLRLSHVVYLFWFPNCQSLLTGNGLCNVVFSERCHYLVR